MLYDFYGNLLTKNQRSVLDLYCNYDLSLGEISERKSISRQAVYDTIKRSEKKLENFEKKLRLVEKFDVIRTSVTRFGEVIETLENEIEDDKIIDEINELKAIVNKMVKTY